MAYDGVNVAAALVGALAAFALGALWYSPALFSRAWLRAVGKTEADVQANRSMAPYITSGVAWLVAAFALAYLLARIPVDGPADALLVAAAAWLLPAAIIAQNGAFEGRPSTLWLVNGGYALAGFLLIAAVIAYWP